jgi:outer membrane murein-binding lipoprotein Lpp
MHADLQAGGTTKGSRSSFLAGNQDSLNISAKERLGQSTGVMANGVPVAIQAEDLGDKVDSLVVKVDDLVTKVDALVTKVDALGGRVDALGGRVDRLEKELGLASKKKSKKHCKCSIS